MFSPNQLYDYLRNYLQSSKKHSILRSFIVDGSKNLSHLSMSYNIYSDVQLFDNNVHGGADKLREQYGCMDMFDQEPLDINAYYNITHDAWVKQYPKILQLNFSPNDFVFARSMALYTPILCHSEKNSNDVVKFNENFYTTVHFWSNAILSRYWFSHYELLSKNNPTTSKRFGAYIRDTTGTRTYRSKLLNFFKSSHLIRNNVFCPIIDGDNVVPSDASASIIWEDHNKFDIQIVPETIFNTEKVHLTEKIFKPIVMYQPFILMSGPHGLKYLRSYGFKTFGDIWDESYDDEIDNDIRFSKITNVITKLSTISDDDYNTIIEKTKNITKFNRERFYSDAFKNILLDELKNGVDSALSIQEEKFHTMPGGTLFYYYDMYYKENGAVPRNTILSLHNAIHYARMKSPKVADAIVKKYSHLL
jgi:hypothetical protein